MQLDDVSLVKYMQNNCCGDDVVSESLWTKFLDCGLFK